MELMYQNYSFIDPTGGSRQEERAERDREL